VSLVLLAPRPPDEHHYSQHNCEHAQPRQQNSRPHNHSGKERDNAREAPQNSVHKTLPALWGWHRLR